MNRLRWMLGSLAMFCGTIPSQASDVRWEAAPSSIPDVTLIDQNGRTVHFRHDLVQGKTVAIQFLFTTCRMACPTLAATFRDLQRSLGQNEHVQFISITVDPEHDRPEVLHAFAEHWKVQPGWSLLTGERADINRLLASLGAATAPGQAHTSMMLIGREGRWSRAFTAGSASVLVHEAAAWK